MPGLGVTPITARAWSDAYHRPGLEGRLFSAGLGVTPPPPAQVDIWAAGCIMAELLSRRPLFPGADYVKQARGARRG